MTKKTKISQRKNVTLKSKNFTVKELLKIFHSIESANDKDDSNLE